MAINDAEIRFKASLEDDVSPKAAKLEDQLKKMGATPIEIKMMMKAVDDATPKMKEMQKEIDRMKKQQIRFTAVSDAKEHIDVIKRASAEPIKLNFVDNLKETTDRLFSLRANVPTNIGGLNVRGLGAGAGIAGLAAGAAGVVKQGVEINSEREQSMVQLTQTLKDSTQATREMGQIQKIAQQTPFNYKDVLAADVRLRSYQIPTMKGEGGPGNQGWLKPAGDMAAAMNTPITQAVEAIADARQGYFVRMMSYGIRMMREDFQPGGKYAGQTYEQGLTKAIRRFEGAQEMQSKTFQGVMSNLQDILQNQILKPIGEPAFNAAKNIAQGIQDKFDITKSSGLDSMRSMGATIDKVQQGMMRLYEQIQKGKQYFQENLQQPLTDLAKLIVHVGGEMAKAFGQPFIAVLSTLASVFTSIIKPVESLVKGNTGLLQIYATFKALSILGFTGPAKGLHEINGALNPMHPSIFRLIDGFRQLSSGLAKVGVALIVKGFIDAKSAANELHKSLDKIGQGDSFDKINAKLARTANLMGLSSTEAKKLAAEAAKGPSGVGGTDAIIQQVKDAAQIQSKYGIGAGDANDAITKQMKYLIENDPRKASRNQIAATETDAANAIRDLKVAADSLNLSFKDVSNVMSQYGESYGKVGIGGAAGARYISSLAAGARDPRFQLSQDQLGSGINTKTALLESIAKSYHNPSVDMLRAIPTNQLGNFFNFQGGAPAAARSSMGYAFGTNSGFEIPDGSTARLAGGVKGGRALSASNQKAINQMMQLGDEYTSSKSRQSAQGNLQSYIDKVTGGGVKLPDMIWKGGSSPDLRGLFKSGQSNLDQAKGIKEALQKTDTELKGNTDEIKRYQDAINLAEQRSNALTQATAKLGMQMQAMQHTWVGQQRQIEDLSLAVSKYSFDNLHPLERQMARLGQASTEMGTKMSNAQYQMGKWNTGLLSGEQAALDSVHAMEKYNRSLQIMQLQYSQIGAQLGQTTYENGTKLRVEPLAGITLQQQSQVAQRRLQLKQLQNEQTFGEGHYQMQQAARSAREKAEIPLGDRLKGIKENVGVIDDLTVKQHDMQNAQAGLQSAMFKVTEKIQDQQDHIQTLSLALQDKQLHGGMRELEDKNYRLGRASQFAGNNLTILNSQLAQVQQSVDALKDRKQILTDFIQSMMKFDDVDVAKAMRRLMQFASKTGQLTPKQRDIFMSAITDMEQSVKDSPINDKQSFIESVHQGVKRGVVGLLTGETYRSVGDQFRQAGKKLQDAGVPGAQSLGNLLGSAAVTAPLTAMAVGVVALTLPKALGVIARQAFVRVPLTVAARRFAPGLGSGTAIKIAEIQADLRKTFVNRIPGVRRLINPSSSSALYDIMERGIARETAKKLGGGGFWEAMKEVGNLSKRARTALGALGGAALGGMVFGPPGAVIGGMMGGAQGGRTPLRSWGAGIKKIIDTIIHPIDTFKKGATDVKEGAKNAVKSATHMEEAQKTAAKASDIFHGSNVKFAERVAEMKGPISKFAAAAGLIAGSFAVLGGWIQKIPGVHKPHVPITDPKRLLGPGNHDEPPARTGEAGRAAAELKAAEKAMKAAGNDPEQRAKTAGRLGNALKWAGRLGIAAGGISAGNSLLHGDVVGAADTASYLVPYVGGTRITADLINKFNTDKDPNNALRQKRVATAPVLQALTQRFGDMRRPIPAGSDITDNEKNYLTGNLDEQRAIAKQISSQKMTQTEYDKHLRRLRDLQDDYNRKFVKATDDGDQVLKDHVKASQEAEVTRLNTHMGRMHKETDTGFGKINKTTSNWLDKIVKEIDKFNKKLGLTTTTDPSGVPSDATTSNAGTYSGGKGSYAHGGIPQQHLIKGKGDGKGHLIRVGEEHDEVIIPLAPHRRDRAKSLIKQVQGRLGGQHHCGPNCAQHGKFANGGIPGQDLAYHTARGAYDAASASFANGGFTGPHGSLAGLGPVANLAMQKFGLSVTAGRTDHSHLTTGGNVSDHSWGGAIDLSNSTAPTPQMDAWFQFARTKLKDVIKQLIYKHTLVNTGNAASPYAANDHFNHVHTAILPQYANDADLTAKILADAEKGVSFKSLLKNISADAGAVAAMARPKLTNVPKALKKMGAVGKALHKALRKLKTAAANGAITGSAASTGDRAWGGGNYKGALDKVFPSHYLNEAKGHVRLSPRQVAMLATKAGLPGSLFEQIAHGESSYFPGVVQRNPGDGMIGYGLWQMTPNAWGKGSAAYKRMEQLGGLRGMLNPWHNAQMAKFLYDHAPSKSPGQKGFPWYGTHFVSQHAAGKKRIESPTEFAVLHQGESVLNPAQAQHYADISEGKRGDMANPMTKKQTDALISIEDRIRKAVKHLESLDDKAIKQSDKKDLAALNLELRRKWGQIESPTKANRDVSKAVLAAGDTTGGEGTAALVSKEQGILAKTEAGDIKKDNDLVKEMKNLSGIASSLLKHAQGPLQIKLAQIAVRATDRAKKSASAVTAYTKTKVGKAAVKEVARGKYIQGAAKRGVSDKLIKSITGKALSRKKVAVGRTASGKVRSVSQLGAYRTVQKARLQVNRAKATKKKSDDAPANKALIRALSDLRKTTSAGFSKSAQHLIRLRSQASKDAVKARIAVANSIKSQLKVKDLPPNIQKIVSKLSQGHSLTSKEQKQLKAELAKHGIKGRATSHQLHDALRKTTSKSSKASASSINAHASAISAAVRAKMDKNHDGQISAAEKRAYAAREKLTDVSKKTKEGGDKTHDKIKEHIGKSKEQLDVAKKADDKKDKADSNQDKRERDFYKQALAHLDAISSKNFAVTVTNHATGATITSSVSSRARGK